VVAEALSKERFGNDTMHDAVMTGINQVTAEWLTSALVSSGALTRGAVASFELETGQGNWSTNARLIVNYTDKAQGSLPGRLFLKMVDTDLGDESFDASEVNYYRRDYADVEGAPLLRCYDAQYSEDLGRYHILLDDVSETHFTAAGKEPSLDYGLALAEGLAVLHARWWGGRRLVEAGAPMHSASRIRSFVARAEPGVDHILRRFSSELKPHWPDALRELFARHPQAMIERTKDPNGFTLIHGDVGEKNILVPRQGDRPIYIIDRQPFDWALTTWLGVYDLAYAIVLDWEIETRRRCEIPILKHYHACLNRYGVRGYSWEQLFDDYRLCVAMCVYVTTEYCRGGINERWIHTTLAMLQQSLTACDDLEITCQEGLQHLRIDQWLSHDVSAPG